MSEEADNRQDEAQVCFVKYSGSKYVASESTEPGNILISRITRA